ncbi:MAG: hypothetical protein DDT32_01268 [Syntrophomonadaceae bacterium]|nr:hypothetical protein [Bacillota bacterium]MBT9147511.1 hypothetical protein [Bacillota bacterium]
MKVIRLIGSLVFVLGLFTAIFAGILWFVYHDPTLPWWMLLQNSAEVPGREITETLGLVKGHTIFAIWLGNDLSALVRLVLGGELIEYTEMMGRAREVATDRMIAQATDMGADAIINVRYMTTSVIGSAAELLAYGTAVKLSGTVT